MQIRDIFRENNFRFYLDSPTNQQFVILDNATMARLRKKVRFEFWEKYDDDHTVVRFASSWATTQENIDALRKIISEL